MDHDQTTQAIRQATIEFLSDPEPGKTLTICGFTMTWQVGGVVELTLPGGAVQLWQFER